MAITLVSVLSDYLLAEGRAVIARSTSFIAKSVAGPEYDLVICLLGNMKRSQSGWFVVISLN